MSQFGNANLSYNYDQQLAPNDRSAKMPLTQMRKRRLNLVAMCLSFFVPWLIFCCVGAFFSFSIRYKMPFVVTAIAFLALALVLWLGYVAYWHLRSGQAGDASSQPSWYCFLFLTSLLAWCLAVAGGRYNFAENTAPYYDVASLNKYENVDPSTMQGVQVMDGGKISFTVGSKLDVKRAIGFRNDRTYCVAPITVNNQPLLSYDYWAVGVDCCSGEPGDFKCGAYQNRKAHAGLRMMHDEYRPFFRLAVQQAEAKFQMKAVHPLFFTWTEDPDISADAYKFNGYRVFFAGMLGHFALQLILVLLAGACFVKGGL